MNLITVLSGVIVLGIILLVIKKCGGGCCGGMKKDDKGHEHKEGSCCKH